MGVFLGVYFGFWKEPIEFPVKYSNIFWPIFMLFWYFSFAFTVTTGGILPFGACFVELFFILSSMWMDQYYYVFGFIFFVFVIFLIICVEIIIVFLYFQLCVEDYRWWWRIFFILGSTVVYVFVYSSLYFTKLESNFLIIYFFYFGYMLIICFGIFLFTGTTGF